MNRSSLDRRKFLKRSAGIVTAGITAPYWFTSLAQAAASANDRPHVGAIGVANKGLPDAQVAAKFGDIVAVCDVDSKHAENAKDKLGGKADIYEDYRKLLDRKDIDAVLVVTPDHWHTKIAIDAMRAGKDVYLEKPMTLTVDEGKALIKVVKETGRVMQVGSQQRSDARFRLACELVRNGRLGKLQKVTVGIVEGRPGGPFENKPVPQELNWDMWLGQAPLVDFCPERCHYNFRFWFEYSGGQMTNWGAHHMDIAHWAMGMDDSGPLSVYGHADLPKIANGYNVPTTQTVDYVYPGNIPLQIVTGRDFMASASENAGNAGGRTGGGSGGVIFTGDKGTIQVDRRALTGAPVEELKENPLPTDAIRLYESNDHMGNFFDCMKSRRQPVSDVVSQHRTATACHIGNISMRLGRKLTWDAQRQEFVGDAEANAMLSRPQRKGYEIVA